VANANLTADRFGKLNSALRLNQGYAQLPQGVYFNGEFSLMAWVKPRSTTEHFPRVIEFGNGAGTDNIIFSYSYANSFIPLVHFYLYNTFQPYSFVKPIQINVWTHLAFTISTSIVSVYINGTCIANYTNIVLPLNITHRINYIGKSNWNHDSIATADFDDIKIFSKALSAADVYKHYSSTYNNL
jgi:hypothetical protein